MEYLAATSARPLQIITSPSPPIPPSLLLGTSFWSQGDIGGTFYRRSRVVPVIGHVIQGRISSILLPLIFSDETFTGKVPPSKIPFFFIIKDFLTSEQEFVFPVPSL